MIRLWPIIIAAASLTLGLPVGCNVQKVASPPQSAAQVAPESEPTGTAPTPTAAQTPHSGPCREVTARVFEVARVVDGDTLMLASYDGEPTPLRLWGIDTPERGETGFQAATEALRELVDGRQVVIEFPGDSKRDSFGRLLCRVEVDGQDVGQVLLRRGVAERHRPE